MTNTQQRGVNFTTPVATCNHEEMMINVFNNIQSESGNFVEIFMCNDNDIVAFGSHTASFSQ